MELKIIFIILLVSVSSVLAIPSYSQTAKVSVNAENKSLEKVLDEIESQSEFYFMFNHNQIDVNRVVSLQKDNILITDILSELFLGTDVKYVVSDRQIILTSKTIKVNNDLPQQQKEIKGIITDESGSPLPGVNIMIEGTTIGVLSNANGEYSISIPNDDAILIFSFIGFETLKVSTNGRLTVSPKMIPSNTILDEVVVTALGIKRESKSIGYAASTVNPRETSTISVVNIGNALTGKVAGMNVSVPASGVGGSSKIRIRGQSSFSGNNSPLIVVNGVPINNDSRTSYGNADLGDGLQSVNPDDIESMTVLKGASAAALYGFRAKDGVIIITTKTGSSVTGIGVEINSSFTADQPLDFTDFQYEYGQGEGGLRNTSVSDALRNGTWSFGPKFDGLPIWSVDGLEHPYVPFKNRIRAFYDTGINITNSVALSGGNTKGGFHLSLVNADANSIVPNSTFNKKNLDLGLAYKLGEKLSFQANANYSIETYINPPVTGGESFNINNTLLTMANSIDPTWMKDNYKNPVTGNEICFSRFTNRTNMYWTAYERHEENVRDRLYGNVLLKYQFTPWLYLQGRIGEDFYIINHEMNQPTGTAFLNPAVSGFNGSFSRDFESFREVNSDFLLGANKEFGDLGIVLTVGGNSMNQVREQQITSVTNFYLRDLYTIGNGQIKNPNYTYYRKKVNSLYGTADLSFKDYLFLNLTARNDWFSTLDPRSNSYLYPSISSSFLFSQAFASHMPSWVDYGKIRAAYAEVGGDTDPYMNILYYSLDSNAFDGAPLGDISTNISPNPNLKPLKVKESEIGMELIFLNRRVSLDIAAYNKNTVDEILNVDIDNTSGYEQVKVNLGKLRNRGVELLLTLVPFRTQNFTWESGFNYTNNKSKVLALSSGQKIIDLGANAFRMGTSSAEIGQPMGLIRGIDYRRDSEGRIITSQGRILAGDIVTFGSAIPVHIGGWLNTFTYKDFRIFAQIDFKAGHKISSATNFNQLRHGLTKTSLVGREGGVVFESVNADGTPNTTAVEAGSFYADYRSKSIVTPFVYNASFIRWRTLSISYDLTRLFVNRGGFIKGMSITSNINNFLMIKKYTDNLDPESVSHVSDLMSGLESSSLPTTRSYGLNLNIKF